MNRSILIGFGIFITVIISLLTVSLTMDVKAQAVLNQDTNTSPSIISYQLNISELNLTNQFYTVYNSSTNTSMNTNTTNSVVYICVLNFNNTGYTESGSTTNTSDIITILQNVTSMPDGYYSTLLDCTYGIATLNQTTINLTNVSTSIINSSIDIKTQKTILIDSIAPNITINNQNNSGNTSNTASTYLNLTLSDLSPINCTINLSNPNTPNSIIPLSTNTTTLSNATTFVVPLNVSSGIYNYSVSCSDSLGNMNALYSSINVGTTYEIPFFDIDLSKPAFSLGEIGQYIIHANNGSNVTITICPLTSGWVQCYVTPAYINDTFPKTQALPYTNKTGKYVISGVMSYKNYTLSTNATYDTSNTLTASITASETTGVIGDIITFNATAAMGISPYTFKWTLDDGTTFTGAGAYKNYTSAGTYHVNLSVNDSQGNNYSTGLDVAIKNKYSLTVLVMDQKDDSRVSDAVVTINDDTATTDSNGLAVFNIMEGNYDIYVSKNGYGGYVNNVVLNKDQTVYMNMSFVDLTPPKISMLVDNDTVFSKDTVNLKFSISDNSNSACSLYTASVNDSWYVLKDSGDNLLSDTEYTFEIRDLNNGAYKWKLECTDADQNKAYSEERRFIISDGSVTTALNGKSQSSDDMNTALDNLDKLSGEESDVADVLGIKTDLKDLLDRINRMDKDIQDLAYRRDLNDTGRQDAQNNITQTIEYLKYHTPINLKITDSKTFVKYIKDDDLKSLIDQYLSLKNLKLSKTAFLESTKLTQSKVIISTHVRNVELYYLNGDVKEITLVTKDIQAAKPEEDLAIKNSNTITFVEVIPKTIAQTAKMLTMVNKDFTVLKDDPIIEYPADISAITYYINGTVKPDAFQNTDTVMIEKNVNSVKSVTGLSILGINSISDISIDGQGIMLVLIVLLILFYVIINFELIDKIRELGLGIGSKKKISYIKVLINDALDYLNTEDYDKAALLYREIKLSYEGASMGVKKQVYDESFDLCNQLDLNYATKVLDKVEYYIRIQDRNNAMMELEKLESTYNKLSEKYQEKISERFHNVLVAIRTGT